MIFQHRTTSVPVTIRRSASITLVVALSALGCAIVRPHTANAVPAPTAKAKAPQVAQQPSVGNQASLDLNERGVAALQAKNFNLAEELFRKALDTDPKNLTAVFNLASMYLTNTKPKMAIDLLTDYTGRYDKDPGLFLRLGDAHFSSKDIKQAALAYERAYKLAPNYPGLPAKLGTVYALTNRLTEAEPLFLIAVNQEPKNEQLLASLSNIFVANNKTDLAIAAAKRALQIKPSKEAYAALGSAYELQRDSKEAIISFERAIALGDARPEIKEKLAALKRVQESAPSNNQGSNEQNSHGAT